MKYFKLLDPVHKNTIVRAEGRNQQEYVIGQGWVESGILMVYFCDESPLYDMYEEVTEEKAMRIINN